jgi:hypothetical protein
MKQIIIVLVLLAAFYYFASPYENCMRSKIKEINYCSDITKW